jgi:hypothetical protein
LVRVVVDRPWLLALTSGSTSLLLSKSRLLSRHHSEINAATITLSAQAKSASIHQRNEKSTVGLQLFAKIIATGAREPTPTANTEYHWRKLLVLR